MSLLEYFSVDEINILNNFSNVIIWGYPLHSHTQSYIHACWYKTFKKIHNNTFWFNDDDYPKDFNYNNSLFITEGYCDKNIPINNSSVYFVNFTIDPEKYINNSARLIDIRFNVIEINDINITFNLNDGTHNIEQLSEFTKYEVLTSNKDIGVKFRNQIKSINYEAIYLLWATDLLPNEFNYDDINYPKENKIYYIGSPINSINYPTFRNIALMNNIEWVIINPWIKPIDFSEAKLLMNKSIFTPDFRPIGTFEDTKQFGIKNGKNHQEIGYIPCRIFKSLSYGNLGITDSKYVKQFFGDHVIYSSDMNELFNMAYQNRNNKEMIYNGMKYVQENHTYIHRVRDLLRALLKPKPKQIYDTTIITALYDINREKTDGRTFEHYIDWFKKTLQMNEPMVIYIDKTKKIYNMVNDIRKTINYPTLIIETNINDIPCYWMYDNVNKIISSDEWKNKCLNKNDITNLNPLYVCIQYSKFEWLYNASNIINWNSKTFTWVDAGISRFFDQLNNLNKNIIKETYENNKFTIQGISDFNYLNKDTYIGTNKCLLKGTIFLSTIEKLHKIKEYVNQYINYMFQHNIIDNEQIILALIYQDNKDLFNIINNTDSHLNNIFFLNDKSNNIINNFSINKKKLLLKSFKK
jgi:hypothetical protein